MSLSHHLSRRVSSLFLVCAVIFLTEDAAQCSALAPTGLRSPAGENKVTVETV